MPNFIDKALIREAYDRRVAVRVYDKEKVVSRDDMEFILDTAWLSPSSVGLEGWRFVVLDRKQIEKLAPKIKEVAWGAQPQLETASHFVLLLAETKARYDSDSIYQSLLRRGLEGDDIQARLDLYQAFQTRDMGMADNSRALFDWTAKQTYIAMGNMMTSASMIGIDTCPIEGFNYGKVNEILAEEGILNPDKEAIASMVSFGYRLKDLKHPRSRKDRNQVITWLED